VISVYFLMEKMDFRRLPEAALNERRRRPVKLRLAGVSIRETASQCELSTDTVMSAQSGLMNEGLAAVKMKRGHRPKGSGRLLSPVEETEVQWLIQDRTPDQLKMNYELWMRQEVSELIEVCAGVRLQVRTVGKYLKRWGYTLQKPLKRSLRAVAVGGRQVALRDVSGHRETRQNRGRAEIHWGDEMGLWSDDVRGRGYAPKGQTPVLRINAKREGLSVISTAPTRARCAGRSSPERSTRRS
jgi:transposase